MKRLLVFALLTGALITPASATTVVYVPVDQSIDLSEVVAVGHVLRMEPAYNRDGDIVTEVHLLVEEALKGSARAGEVLTFHAWGGSLDGVQVETVGEARYQLGEKVLVQLEEVEGAYHTLGLAFGKWNVVRGEKGLPMLQRSLADLQVVGATEAPVERLPLRALRAIVEQRREP